jgi:hypothetical protein
MICHRFWFRLLAVAALAANFGVASAADNDCKAVVTFKKAELVSEGKWIVRFNVRVTACDYSEGGFSYTYRTSPKGDDIERSLPRWNAQQPKQFDWNDDSLNEPGKVQAVKVLPGSITSSKPARNP